MQDLIDSINRLKSSEISEVIKSRINEFSEIRDLDGDTIFKELCFCIMTANCAAEKCIEIHEKIGEKFNFLSQTDLTKMFKKYGYRFPNIRSQYIIQARDFKIDLEEKIKLDSNDELREWLIKNIKGFGYKEASHFLRNIGFNDYAIVDFHIVDLLVEYNLIEKPKSMSKQKYIEIEIILKNIANKLDLSLAELDLYLWFLETGKILK
ncbi:MAG: N-glycosylase/DNA lyase [Candidatus Heimdallarchaeota archaeon]